MSHGPYSRRGLGAGLGGLVAIESSTRPAKKMIGISNVTADQLTLLCMKAN